MSTFYDFYGAPIQWFSFNTGTSAVDSYGCTIEMMQDVGVTHLNKEQKKKYEYPQNLKLPKI